MSLKNKEILFAKYLSGNASSEEVQILTNWLKADPSNQAEFDHAQSIWNTSLNLKKEEEPDLEKAWNDFKRLRELQPEAKVKTIRFGTFKIAAAIALFIVLGIVVKFSMTEPSISSTPQLSEVVKPNQAIITESPDLDYSEIDSLYYEEPSATSKPSTVKRKIRTLSNGLAIISVSSKDTAEIFLLPDNTLVYLNANSKLEYPGNFDRNNRNVTLVGEAYFDVKKDTNQFTVTCENTIVKSKLASFNIKGHSNEKEVEVLVAAGNVQFSGVGYKDFKKLELKEGESGIYNKSKSDINKVKHQRTNQKWWEKKSFRERIKNFFDRMLGKK